MVQPSRLDKRLGHPGLVIPVSSELCEGCLGTRTVSGSGSSVPTHSELSSVGALGVSVGQVRQSGGRKERKSGPMEVSLRRRYQLMRGPRPPESMGGVGE